MTKKTEREAVLAGVKIALAEKYERLVAISGGAEKKKTLLRRAQRYRNQAKKLLQAKCTN